jgi:hypothetical protein
MDSTMKWRTTVPGCTEAEWRAFQQLRLRYQQDHDWWTTREAAHLRFLRWLVETGRLSGDGSSGKDSGAS